MMTPRENALSLYRRTGYRFMPVSFGMCPAVRTKMVDAIGEGVSPGNFYDYPEGFAGAGTPGPKRVQADAIDWRTFYAEELHPDTSFNAYGVAMEGGHEGTHHLRRMHHPLAGATSMEELESYPWPEWDWEDAVHIEDAVRNAHARDLCVTGGMAMTIWETAWYIRDMTQLMMDMAMDDEKAVFILDKITEDSARRAAAFARGGVDIISMGDDIGMQNTIMMAESMYREWLKPRLREVIAAARAEKPDVLIHYHSCGYVEPYITDLIEIGVDILNPVQPECMSFEKLHAEYGDCLSFNGTLGTQTTMPFGTPDDVRDVVFRNLEIAGEKGGLGVCPTHMLEPEVPWENVAAYICACRDVSRSKA